jgi:hypothetical protein
MITGRELLEVGAFLESMDGEASTRTQTGRAYYAAFLESRTFCERYQGHIRKKSGREHAEVPMLLSGLDAELPVDLAFLRKLRNMADYETDISQDTVQRQAVLAKEFAHRFIARLDELAPAKQDATESGNPSESDSPEDE